MFDEESGEHDLSYLFDWNFFDVTSKPRDGRHSAVQSLARSPAFPGFSPPVSPLPRISSPTTRANRRHFASGPSELQPLDDELLARLQAAIDDRHIAVFERSDFDRPMLDDVVGPDDEQILSLLIGAQGAIRHQQRIRLRADRHPNSHEQPGAKRYGCGLGNTPRTEIVPVVGSTWLSAKSMVPLCG